MGSVGNQNPWTPYYDNYRDCSLGICSIYCPQFCNLIFPPPPIYNNDSPPFSPLIVAIIGILASAFLLVSYYTIVTRFCNRRNVHSEENEENHVEMNHDQWMVQPVQPVGLEEGLIEAITVCKYKKGDGLIEGSECAVCLSEFQENESLRLLPKCDHAFHLPCIDTWLKSHSNCPLCRATVIVLVHPIVNTNAYEVQQSNALVLVVDDHCEQRVVLSDHQDNAEDLEAKEENIGSVQDCFRRSVSLGNFPDFDKNDEDIHVDIGTSKGFVRSPVEMKRSISTGRYPNYKGKH